MSLPVKLVVVACAATSPTVALARPGYHAASCATTSHVVGRACLYYGSTWSSSLPLNFSGDLGYVQHRFLAPLDATTVDGPKRYELTSDPSRARGISASGPRARMMVDLTGRLGYGLELDYEHVTTSPAVMAEMMGGSGTASVVHATSVFGFHAVTDYHIPIGRFTLTTEFATGIDFVSYAVTSDATLALEARERGELWLTPTYSLAVTGGIDIVDRHNTTLVLSFGAHSRAFGGG